MALALGSQASSSSFMDNSAQPCHRYDVFLSLRGETRKNFTDHLYNAMKQQGINTFRDDDAMERGRLLKPELTKAIHESAISLIVFSKDYASSKWCLDEVLMIMEQHERSSSKHHVVPVFYNVDPTDVRHQTGCFKEAFDRYDDIIKAETNIQKKNEWLEKVNAWKGALNKVGSLTGMVLGDGYEAQFITSIVKDIRKKLNYNALYIEGNLVGMKDDVAEIESWLQDTSPNSTVLFIHGMGGIGKTTLAKCIFNSNCRYYDGNCFLANINEESNKPNGLLRLQIQLLSKILKSEKEEKMWNVDEGTARIIKAIHSKRILLVLDDVTTSQQLYALLGTKRFYPRSKVIITTRDKSLSNSFEVHPKLQLVRTLSTDDSIKLFSLYAFYQNQPTEPYIVQSKLVIHHCLDLPLALKVLGTYLCGKSIKEWEDARFQLDESPHPGIQKVLQMSYETLEFENDKELFLHIACFFVLEDEDYIVKLLAKCKLFPVIGIKNLKDRCLVYDEYGKVGMHPLIREMGQEVVRQESPKYPGKRSRLWRHEDCIKVLEEDEGTEKVEGLMLDMQKNRDAKYGGKRVHGNEENFNIGALEKMKNLMLLGLNYAKISGNCNNLPKNLRLLRWHGFPQKYIPCDIPLEKLVVLDMSYSKLKRVWDDYKVVHEHGIFSTFVTKNQIPYCSRYTYKKKGPEISYKVAENDSRLITSFNLCLVFSQPLTYFPRFQIQVYNKTKALLWTYVVEENCENPKKGWVSLWRCGNLLDHGDEIFVRILDGYKKALCVEVEECCINLIYEEDNENNNEQHDDEEWERKEGKNKVVVSASDGIAWSDRMFIDISDCVHNGTTYEFGCYRGLGLGCYRGFGSGDGVYISPLSKKTQEISELDFELLFDCISGNLECGDLSQL